MRFLEQNGWPLHHKLQCAEDKRRPRKTFYEKIENKHGEQNEERLNNRENVMCRGMGRDTSTRGSGGHEEEEEMKVAKI